MEIKRKIENSILSHKEYIVNGIKWQQITQRMQEALILQLQLQLSSFIGIKLSYNCSHRTSRRGTHSQCDRSEPGRFHLPLGFSKEFGTMGDGAYL